jgi:hypothetical protein
MELTAETKMKSMWVRSRIGDPFQLSYGALPRIFGTRRCLLLATLVLRQELTAANSKHLDPRLGLLDDARIGQRRMENWAGALHSEAVSCMLPVGPETEMEIAARMKIRIDKGKTK